MKIKKIEENYIEFDNGNILTDFHDQTCYEWVYADFSGIQISTKISCNQLDSIYLEFNEDLLKSIKCVEGLGFTIESTYGIKLFVSCYNIQNGFYSSDLALVYKTHNKTEKLDISNCVQDIIW